MSWPGINAGKLTVAIDTLRPTKYAGFNDQDFAEKLATESSAVRCSGPSGCAQPAIA